MKSLVVYDSTYGNTASVAKAIAEALKTEAVKVSDVKDHEFTKVDLLVLGSPTQGGRATEAMQKFISELSTTTLETLHVAVFDTRFALKKHGKGLFLLMKTIGFAAPKMAKALKQRHAKLVGQPEGFIVKDKQGPLEDGEIDRATEWAKSLVK